MEIIDALAEVNIPWQALTLIPTGDFQAGSPGFDSKRLRNLVSWGVDHDAWWHGMGDYSDIMSPSNRTAYQRAGLYDTTRMAIEAWHKEHMGEVEDILAPTKGRWVGLHEGHHYLNYENGETSDMRLAEFLGCPFLGTTAITQFNFRDENKHKAECLMYSTHGEGSSSDPVAKLKRVAPGFPQMDIFLQGHNTQLASQVLGLVEVYRAGGSLRQRDRNQYFIATGGYMKGYTQGSKVGNRAQGSYVEKAMMRPTAIGAPVIRITPEWEHGYTKLKIEATVGGN